MHHLPMVGVAWIPEDFIEPEDYRHLFADANIIYAFHFYEPFIFTHQGTSWTDLGATHDIPYPYEADRWSEYYEDLGFDPTGQPS